MLYLKKDKNLREIVHFINTSMTQTDNLRVVRMSISLAELIRIIEIS